MISSPSWFNSEERIQKLRDVAQTWIGTPFVANSRCKGERGGVSCQMLAEQIYKESGVPFSFRVPSASMHWAGMNADSLIVAFLSEHPELLTHCENPAPSDIIPGDLLGFKIGKCIHHVGVALSDKQFIHCMRGTFTVICPISDPAFASRLTCLWRIKP